MVEERGIDTFLRLAGQAAAEAERAADPATKAQWQDVARAYRQVAQRGMRAARLKKGSELEGRRNG